MREKKKYSAVLAGAAASMLLTTQNVIAEDVNNSTENMGTQTPDASETTAEAAVFEAPEVVDDQTTSHSITINVKAGLQYSISSEQDKPDKEWNAIVTEDGEYTFSDLDADQEYYIQAKKADGTVSEVLDVKTPAEETAAPSEEAVSVNQIAVAESQIAESKVAETEKAAEPKVTPAGHEYADAAGWHYVDGNGHVITGFYTLPYGKKVYYDANGVMAHGQKLIDGYWYYFDEFDGAMQTGWKYIPYQNKTVYYDADGKMLKGDQIIDGKEYYFDSYYGARTYGIVDLGKEGKVCLTAQGRVKNQEKLINDSWYYFDKEGHMVTGFYTLPYGKKVYYDADGAMAHGQKLIDGYWYYFDEFDGAMQTGWKYIPYQNKTVYYDADGKMLKGDQIIDGKEYYFDSYYGARTYGWVESENAYYTSEGKKYSNLSGQQAFDGHWYYFDETSHKPVTGFKYIANQNKTVYYNEKGEMQYGEKALNGHWYYFNPVTGAMATGFVYLPNGNKTVYYNSNGQMLYGEHNIDGYWYYFNPVTGAEAHGFTALPDGRTIYYDGNGHMIYGKQSINGHYYYFDTVTGAMARNTTINGEHYTSSGVLLSDYTSIAPVPFIDQYANGAPTGCEGAAALQALKGLGYCQNMSLHQFLDGMPYSWDGSPNHGFVGSPYTDSWGRYASINPGPLTPYVNRFAPARNISGASTDQLLAELREGHPVIVWGSLRWKSSVILHYSWGIGLSTNHCMTLYGYNPSNGSLHIMDPIYGDTWVSRSSFDSIYNIRRYAISVG